MPTIDHKASGFNIQRWERFWFSASLRKSSNEGDAATVARQPSDLELEVAGSIPACEGF